MYEQAFQERTIELKEKIKILHKQSRVTTLLDHEKHKINSKIEHLEHLVKLVNVRKVKLRELSNGMIVNALILDKFIVKLKRKFEYRLSVSDGGLVLEYWSVGHTHEKPTGKLALCDLSEHYLLYDVPYLENTYMLGEIQ